ncbi:YceI family protein [Aureisphaera galaxeae]|uniref:YceI family protein n=1 Tax=Aureisphaera galaxeae TaxID=1538023 RepID=UPI002350BEB7|nr:YceI family protein [Aureisphaera galaxeae]MDC8003830.1 YceI family protein [Aureisphaera galaxeae]
MKKVALLMLTLCFALPSFGQDKELKKLTVESNHSTLLFSVPISGGITRIAGKFNDYSMELDMDEDDFTQSKLSVTIQVNSIDTGIPARDEHLLTADFFDVETYPEITFVSETIERTRRGYVVIGTFTMKGVSKTLRLPLEQTGKDGKNTFGFSSRLSINRMDYGVGSDFKHDSMDNFLGERIHVEIDFWTKKRKAPKKTEK